MNIKGQVIKMSNSKISRLVAQVSQELDIDIPELDKLSIMREVKLLVESKLHVPELLDSEDEISEKEQINLCAQTTKNDGDHLDADVVIVGTSKCRDGVKQSGAPTVEGTRATKRHVSGTKSNIVLAKDAATRIDSLVVEGSKGRKRKSGIQDSVGKPNDSLKMKVNKGKRLKSSLEVDGQSDNEGSLGRPKSMQGIVNKQIGAFVVEVNNDIMVENSQCSNIEKSSVKSAPKQDVTKSDKVGLENDSSHKSANTSDSGSEIDNSIKKKFEEQSGLRIKPVKIEIANCLEYLRKGKTNKEKRRNTEMELRKEVSGEKAESFVSRSPSGEYSGDVKKQTANNRIKEAKIGSKSNGKNDADRSGKNVKDVKVERSEAQMKGLPGNSKNATNTVRFLRLRPIFERSCHRSVKNFCMRWKRRQSTFKPRKRKTNVLVENKVEKTKLQGILNILERQLKVKKPTYSLRQDKHVKDEFRDFGKRLKDNFIEVANRFNDDPVSRNKKSFPEMFESNLDEDSEEMNVTEESYGYYIDPITGFVDNGEESSEFESFLDPITGELEYRGDKSAIAKSVFGEKLDKGFDGNDLDVELNKTKYEENKASTLIEKPMKAQTDAEMQDGESDKVERAKNRATHTKVTEIHTTLKSETNIDRNLLITNKKQRDVSVLMTEKECMDEHSSASVKVIKEQQKEFPECSRKDEAEMVSKHKMSRMSVASAYDDVNDSMKELQNFSESNTVIGSTSGNTTTTDMAITVPAEARTTKILKNKKEKIYRDIKENVEKAMKCAGRLKKCQKTGEVFENESGELQYMSVRDIQKMKFTILSDMRKNMADVLAQVDDLQRFSHGTDMNISAIKTGIYSVGVKVMKNLKEILYGKKEKQKANKKCGKSKRIKEKVKKIAGHGVDFEGDFKQMINYEDSIECKLQQVEDERHKRRKVMEEKLFFLAQKESIRQKEVNQREQQMAKKAASQVFSSAGVAQSAADDDVGKEFDDFAIKVKEKRERKDSLLPVASRHVRPQMVKYKKKVYKNTKNIINVTGGNVYVLRNVHGGSRLEKVTHDAVDEYQDSERDLTGGYEYAVKSDPLQLPVKIRIGDEDVYIKTEPGFEDEKTESKSSPASISMVTSHTSTPYTEQQLFPSPRSQDIGSPTASGSTSLINTCTGNQLDKTKAKIDDQADTDKHSNELVAILARQLRLQIEAANRLAEKSAGTVSAEMKAILNLPFPKMSTAVSNVPSTLNSSSGSDVSQGVTLMKPRANKSSNLSENILPVTSIFPPPITNPETLESRSVTTLAISLPQSTTIKSPILGTATIVPGPTTTISLLPRMATSSSPMQNTRKMILPEASVVRYEKSLDMGTRNIPHGLEVTATTASSVSPIPNGSNVSTTLLDALAPKPLHQSLVTIPQTIIIQAKGKPQLSLVAQHGTPQVSLDTKQRTPQATVVVQSPMMPQATIVVQSPRTPQATIVNQSMGTPQTAMVVQSPGTPQASMVQSPQATIVAPSMGKPEAAMMVQSPGTPMATIVVQSPMTPQAMIMAQSLGTSQTTMVGQQEMITLVTQQGTFIIPKQAMTQPGCHVQLMQQETSPFLGSQTLVQAQPQFPLGSQTAYVLPQTQLISPPQTQVCRQAQTQFVTQPIMVSSSVRQPYSLINPQTILIRPQTGLIGEHVVPLALPQSSTTFTLPGQNTFTLQATPSASQPTLVTSPQVSTTVTLQPESFIIGSHSNSNFILKMPEQVPMEPKIVNCFSLQGVDEELDPLHTVKQNIQRFSTDQPVNTVNRNYQRKFTVGERKTKLDEVLGTLKLENDQREALKRTLLEHINKETSEKHMVNDTLGFKVKLETDDASSGVTSVHGNKQALHTQSSIRANEIAESSEQIRDETSKFYPGIKVENVDDEVVQDAAMTAMFGGVCVPTTTAGASIPTTVMGGASISTTMMAEASLPTTVMEGQTLAGSPYSDGNSFLLGDQIKSSLPPETLNKVFLEALNKVDVRLTSKAENMIMTHLNSLTSSSDQGTFGKSMMEVKSLIQQQLAVREIHPGTKTKKAPSKYKEVMDNVPSPDVSMDKFEKKVWTCKVCGRAFARRFSYERHEKVHMKTTKEFRPYIKCHICKRQFSSKKHFKTHYRSHIIKAVGDPLRWIPRLKSGKNQELAAESSCQSSGMGMWGCGACGRGCGSKAHLESHLLCHTGDQAYKCPKCICMFNKETMRQRHLELHKIGEEGSPYQCSMCSNFFWFRKAFEAHSQACGNVTGTATLGSGSVEMVEVEASAPSTSKRKLKLVNDRVPIPSQRKVKPVDDLPDSLSDSTDEGEVKTEDRAVLVNAILAMEAKKKEIECWKNRLEFELENRFSLELAKTPSKNPPDKYPVMKQILGGQTDTEVATTSKNTDNVKGKKMVSISNMLSNVIDRVFEVVAQERVENELKSGSESNDTEMMITEDNTNVNELDFKIEVNEDTDSSLEIDISDTESAKSDQYNAVLKLKQHLKAKGVEAPQPHQTNALIIPFKDDKNITSSKMRLREHLIAKASSVIDKTPQLQHRLSSDTILDKDGNTTKEATDQLRLQIAYNVVCLNTALDSNKMEAIPDTGPESVNRYSGSMYVPDTGPEAVNRYSGSMYVPDTGPEAVNRYSGSMYVPDTGPEAVNRDSGSMFVPDTGPEAVNRYSGSMYVPDTGLEAVNRDSGSMYVPDTGPEAVNRYSGSMYEVITDPDYLDNIPTFDEIRNSMRNDKAMNEQHWLSWEEQQDRSPWKREMKCKTYSAEHVLNHPEEFEELTAVSVRLVRIGNYSEIMPDVNLAPEVSSTPDV